MPIVDITALSDASPALLPQREFERPVHLFRPQVGIAKAASAALQWAPGLVRRKDSVARRTSCLSRRRPSPARATATGNTPLCGVRRAQLRWLNAGLVRGRLWGLSLAIAPARTGGALDRPLAPYVRGLGTANDVGPPGEAVLASPPPCDGHGFRIARHVDRGHGAGPLANAGRLTGVAARLALRPIAACAPARAFRRAAAECRPGRKLRRECGRSYCPWPPDNNA
jgi:hypothetical protein